MNPGKDFSNARKEFDKEIGHTMVVGTYNKDDETFSRRLIQTLFENLHTADLPTQPSQWTRIH
ncbi:hypothetical protein TRAPUB_1959 [Trametes pubescens]|uniref:Uncharacterized protein n=1 Tax=Trametes pubescens TaxID=154538 RepID=A0A1M2VHY7_TRAPU|nr:hypothetical protein TRAPUB_1959 [Trametes pubescens]